MTITRELSERAKVPLVVEVSDSTGKYQMFNTGSVEAEVGEFLYGLVRMIKPQAVLETGLYKGWSGAYIAEALKENEFGHLDTIEIESQHINSSQGLFGQLGLDSWVTIYDISSLEFTPKKVYNLFFLDTEPQIRFSELNRFWDYLRPGGYILIHDLHPHLANRQPPWEDYVNLIGDKIKSYELIVITFQTPRGLVLMQKVSPEMGAYKLLKGFE